MGRAGGAGGAFAMPNKALKKLTTGTIIIAMYWQMPCASEEGYPWRLVR